MTEKINSFIPLIHNEWKEKGFWENIGNSTIEQKFGMIITELSEAIQAHRLNKRANKELFEEEIGLHYPYKNSFENHIKDSLDDEFADTIMRCLDLYGYYNTHFQPSDVKFYSYSIYKRKTFVGSIMDIISHVLMADSCRYCNNTSGIIGCLDTVITDILDISKEFEIDIIWNIEKKVEYNRHRPKEDGKAYH